MDLVKTIVECDPRLTRSLPLPGSDVERASLLLLGHLTRLAETLRFQHSHSTSEPVSGSDRVNLGAHSSIVSPKACAVRAEYGPLP